VYVHAHVHMCVHNTMSARTCAHACEDRGADDGIIRQKGSPYLSIWMSNILGRSPCSRDSHQKIKSEPRNPFPWKDADDEVSVCILYG